MTCMSMRCSCSPMITVLQRRPLLAFPSSRTSAESPPGPALAEATGVSSGETQTNKRVCHKGIFLPKTVLVLVSFGFGITLFTQQLMLTAPCLAFIILPFQLISMTCILHLWSTFPFPFTSSVRTMIYLPTPGRCHW